MTRSRDLASASIVPAAVSVTELGYIDGVTSAIQTQMDTKAATAATINPTIVDAKGDLIAATADNAVSRLAVGANGTSLVADSTTATGLAYALSPGFAAGKNAIINGDFNIWQRGTSFSNPNGVYTADRFRYVGDSTVTLSRQTFTPGTAPVAGYEGTFFLRVAKSAGGSLMVLDQPIEDVRKFAEQTVTMSFYAKADANVTGYAWWDQNFGSGGSGGVGTGLAPNFAITTAWKRFSYTFNVPSISGKTIGTSSFAAPQFIRIADALAHTIDIWGAQLEAGSVATPFQTATGTVAGELAACQRYFQKSFALATAPANNVGIDSAVTFSRQSTSGNVEPQVNLRFPVVMRAAPSGVLFNPYTGTAGQWSDGSTVSANARIFNAGDAGILIDNTDTALNYANAIIHYTLSAEL